MTLSTSTPKNDVGFFGGIKLGYVFGTGVVRPTVEGDFFYNGFRGGAELHPAGSLDDVRYSTAQRDHLDQHGRVHGRTSSCDSRLETKNSSRMPEPGVGVYYAESAGRRG